MAPSPLESAETRTTRPSESWGRATAISSYPVLRRTLRGGVETRHSPASDTIPKAATAGFLRIRGSVQFSPVKSRYAYSFERRERINGPA
jgi:hypothetical protein